MVQLPFCHSCGSCSCKICDESGKEYMVKATLNTASKIDVEILEIQEITKKDDKGKDIKVIHLEDKENFETDFNERGELVLMDYGSCIPGEDHCNCG